MTNHEIRLAYRQLFRAALRAVHYSSPAKYQIRDSIRTAFRNEPAERFDARKIANTKEFLRRAEIETGIEHKILRNLLHVRYFQNRAKRENRLLVAHN